MARLHLGWAALVLFAGCSFDTKGLSFAGGGDDGGVNDIDASAQMFDANPDDPDGAPPVDADTTPDSSPPIDADTTPDADVPDPIGEDVAHVPPAAELSDIGTLTLVDGDMLDTTDLELNGGALPAGVTFDTSPQEAGDAPEIAVLHVRRLIVANNATVNVRGDRPLVVIASREITVDGVLDASAAGGRPGAGGSLAQAGAGAGGDGEHAPNSFRESGGGGAGFGTAGARGGHAICMPNCTNAEGGEAGDSYGAPALPNLVGGSGGGQGGVDGQCTPGAGGAGGGAVQLYSGISIDIGANGGIHVGGGGGSGGMSCSNSSAGGGAGSGGAIFLQAPDVTHQGTLAANGGAGGGAGSGSGGDGDPGDDGVLGVTAAMGGGGGGSTGQAGGNGGTGALAPLQGVDDPGNGGNGGGGGAAVGRIAIIVNTSGTLLNLGITSPAADEDTY